MSKKYRYLLLVIGFIVFVIVAPLTILYVNGFTLNFKNKELSHTGILTLRSEPSEVNFYINDKLVRKNNGDVKFIQAGEYTVSLTKEGYFNWNKRLVVKQDQVAWVNSAPSKLYLLKNDTHPKTLATHITDGLVIESTLYTVQDNVLSIINIKNPEESQNFTLPSSVTTIESTPTNNIILLTSTSTNATILFDINKKTIISLNALFHKNFTVKLSETGQIYALENTNLYQVQTEPLTKNLISEHIRSYALNGKNIYTISETLPTRQLEILSTENGQKQILLQNIPEFTQGSVYISPLKQILLQLDTTLFRVGSELSPITTGVDSSTYDNSHELLTLHGGELSHYNFETGNQDFITRISQQIDSYLILPQYGYAFTSTATSVKAIELDKRDKQNEYELYTGTMIDKIQISPDAKILYIIDNNNFISQELR